MHGMFMLHSDMSISVLISGLNSDSSKYGYVLETGGIFFVRTVSRIEEGQPVK